MSKYLVNDIEQLHTKMGVNKVIRQLDAEKLRKFMEFRVAFLNEELKETTDAIANEDWPEVVDGLIDLVVVALGTLDAYDVDIIKAWTNVHEANYSKEPGIKPSRPNPLGLPDMIKPEGWVAPNHDDNVGLMAKMTTD
jgi:NTP pyrophosphatase (non-canonical NTP hydrolase)